MKVEQMLRAMAWAVERGESTANKTNAMVAQAATCGIASPLFALNRNL